MVKLFRLVALVLPVLLLSGCVTSYYKNKEGEECKRQYLTTLGVSVKKCGVAVVSHIPPGQQGSAGTSAQQAQGGPVVSSRDSGVSVQPIPEQISVTPREVEEEAPVPAKDLPMGPIAKMGE